MKLYTICVSSRPTVVMSVDVVDVMLCPKDNGPKARKSRKATRAMEQLQERLNRPDIRQMLELRDIEEALDTWLGEDLTVLEHDGAPLWDGDRSTLDVREATPEEASRWRASLNDAIDAGEEEFGAEDWLIFLLPVSDPTDDGALWSDEEATADAEAFEVERKAAQDAR